MTAELTFDGSDFEARAISPFREMGAYEALWTEPKATFRSLSERFARNPDNVPSDFVSLERAHECAVLVKQRFQDAGNRNGSECGYTAPESTPTGCEMRRILSNACIIKAGGTWRRRARWRSSAPGNRLERGLRVLGAWCGHW